MNLRARVRSREFRLGLFIATFTTLLLVACGAALGEWLLRYRESHRQTVPGSITTLFYQHKRLRHAHVRDFHYYDWVNINRFGFRGPEIVLQKPAGTLRIMAVGSSTTFDSFVTRDSLAWPARLQAQLKQQRPGQTIEVINAGTAGYTSLDNLFRLHLELLRFEPDIIILYEGHNDLFGALNQATKVPAPFTPRPDEIPIINPVTRWLGDNSMLYAKLASRLQIMRFLKRQPGPETRTVSAEDMERSRSNSAELYRRNLASFVMVANSVGAHVIMPELVHVSDPLQADETDARIKYNWSHGLPFATVSTVLKEYQRYNTIIREVASQQGATFIPTASFGLRGLDLYSDGDPIHFNDKGAERMAGQLAQAVLASGALTKAAHVPASVASTAQSTTSPYQSATTRGK